MVPRALASWLIAVLTVGPAALAGEPRPSRRVAILPDAGPVVLEHGRTATTTDLPSAIDQCVRAGMSTHQTPGAAVAVLIDGAVAYEQGYGVRRRNTTTPVDAGTVFRIGSVTKMMTAAAVMQQVEAGTVNLDDPVTRYVPELTLSGPWQADLITVRELLTHTSEYPDRIFDLGAAGEDALSNWAANQGGVSLHAPPGSFWNYSNPNFALAGLVLERASGTRYRTYIQQHVWDAAGMTHTTFDPTVARAGGDYSWGHYRNPDTGTWQTLAPEDVESWWAGPAAFAFSTVGDLVRWAELLMEGGGPVLTQESADAMQARQVWCHYTPDMYYGYGIVNDRYNGVDVRYHDGSVIGWGTMVLWVPESRFAVAVLANTPEPLANAAFCALDAVLAPPPVDPPDLTTSPATWGRDLGHYDFTDVTGADFPADVDRSGAHLRVTLGSGSALFDPGSALLYQIYHDTFVVDLDGDGAAETDLTFIAGPGSPGATRWLRYRYAVGGRQPGVRLGPRRLP